MKFLFPMLVAFSFIQLTFSQEKELDSIKELVETYKKNDTVRVHLLNELTKYYTTRDISKSKVLIEEAIKISKEINYVSGLGASYRSYGIFSELSGNFDEALMYALKAKKIQDSIQDIEGLILTNSCIARIYVYLKKPDKAIEIQLENLSFFKDDPLNSQKASIHFYLAKAYSSRYNFNEAEVHYKAAKNIAEKVNFQTGVYIANSSLGVLENKRGKYLKAIGYLEPTLKFYETHQQTANIAHTNLELSRAYANLGHVKKAILFNDHAIEIYEKQDNTKLLKPAYKDQSKLYERLQDYKKANIYLDKHYQLVETHFSSQKVRIIEEMKTRYETEKNKAEKEKAEKIVVETKLESQKNYLLFITTIAVAVLLLLSSVFYLYRLKSKKRAELTLLELKETQKRLIIEKQYRASELKALKSQMNPHFIFNALNSVQEYIILNQKRLASDYLGKFADLIRTYLDHSMRDHISLKEEIDCLEMYLELEKLRFEDKLSITVNSLETVEFDTILIPTMLIQPYVENALKHGLLHRKKNRILKIDFNVDTEKEVVSCSIVDNGIGREKAKEFKSRNYKSHVSFATKAIQDRLNLINLNFEKDNRASVNITDSYKEGEPTGTRVDIVLPYITI